MKQIIIKGTPIAKKRPRFVRHGGTYNEQKTEEGRWILEAMTQWKEEPLENPIHLACLFHMPIPKSTSRKKRKELLWHTKKPDIDNLLKFVMDCLSGIVWKDDSQVCGIDCQKIYSEKPSTKILIWGK